MKERFPAMSMEMSDRNECSIALSSYEELLSNKNICEGNCVRGDNCPTGSSLSYFIDFSHEKWIDIDDKNSENGILDV